jgi:hypothetical protein
MSKKVYKNVSVHLSYFDFEGGFWGMTDKNGNQWLPLNLDDAWISQGNIEVVVSFAVDDNIFSLVNWGTPVMVSDIKYP